MIQCVNLLKQLFAIVIYIVPNSFWAMSDLENPSNKSDFYVKNGLNRTEIWLILAKYLTFLHKYKKIRKYLTFPSGKYVGLLC